MRERVLTPGRRARAKLTDTFLNTHGASWQMVSTVKLLMRSRLLNVSTGSYP